METRIKELVAIGAAVTANCQPCLAYHVAKAQTAGASLREIDAAISVGKMVRTGAASKTDRFADTVVPRSSTAAGGSPEVGIGS